MKTLALSVPAFALLAAAATCLAAPRAVVAAEWEPAEVPGPLEHSGEAWLRCWVKVHDSFFTSHARNLFEESVGVQIEDLPGAHEVWVNGTRLGGGGAFPPDYEDGGDRLHRYKVPVGTLVKGEWNEIAIRLHQPDATGGTEGSDGFRGEAPFIMNYFWECVFEGEWELLHDAAYAPGGALPERPDRAAFEEFRESNRVLGRAEQTHGPKMAPQESAATLETQEGLRMDLLLHEPLVTQPFHFSFDARGRLWVAQCRQYPYPAGLTMLSRDRYYRAHYDRVPPAPPHHDPGEDLISIHEDTTGDGLYDTHSVFLEGLNMANAVLPGHGGVWVMHTPYLLFYPDADGDGIPDGPPVVHLEGFGFEDSHSMANGLAWGPDGWLYGGQGSTVSCRVTRPGLDPEGAEGVHFEGCMVWRYDPETRAFEIFSEGGGNTFGLEFDASGRLYSGHNGGDTRGWHFVQGGFYLMQGVDPGKFGPPRNPYAFGDLPMMAATEPVVRFTHIGAFAEGTAMPEDQQGLLFALDPLHNEIIATERYPVGATFETTDRGVAAKAGDESFRPVYIANAPDGSLLVADMYEYYIAHGQHYQNQIDTTTGRIFRLAGEGLPLETDTDLVSKSDDELVERLAHPNKWHRHTAVRLLGERGATSVVPALKARLSGKVGADPSGSSGSLAALASLNALWALHQLGGLDEAAALAGLAHEAPMVRAWTARLLGDAYGVNRNLGLPPGLPQAGEGEEAEADENKVEARPLPAAVFAALLEQVRTEPDAEARAQYASTARRLSREQGFALVGALASHDADLEDSFVPLLTWWVFEAHLPGAAEEVLAFFENAAIWEHPLVVEQLAPRVARRFAVDGRRQDLLHVARLLRLAPGPEAAARAMEGFEEAYRGRAMTALPEELIETMAESGGASLAIRLRQGDAGAVNEALALVADPEADGAERLRYARSLGELRHPEAAPVLLALATGGEAAVELRRAAFAALGGYEDDGVAEATLAALPALPEEARPAALALLASRAAWARDLLARLGAGELSLSLVGAEMADHLRLHSDPQVREAANALFPAPDDSGRDFAAEIAKVEDALAGGPGSPYAGEAHYMQRCAACHKLFFKGGNLGPDLTSYQRDNLGTMLISIVNPDAEIREGYQYITVTTNDGRALSGFQVDRDNRVTVLRGLDGQDLTIPADEIEKVEPMGRSLMPAGLLDGLDEQDLRDIFAYLRISQPISR